MARNVNEAAQGSGEITSNIAGVAEAAQGTTRGATDTQKASQQLVEMSTQLRSLVGQFKINTSGTVTAGDANPSVKGMAAHASA
jgi:methyl-accepting chemotaxis protein